jgi:hypothetical protein
MASERDCVDQLFRDAGRPNLSLQELLALGFLVGRKWDKAIAANPSQGAAVTSEQAAAHDNFTSAELSEFREAANRALLQYAATLPSRGETWSRGFWQGFASAWAYSLSIAVIAIIIKILGSDLLTVLRPLITK